MQLKASPVKEYAISKGLLVLQPEKLKSPDFIQTLQALEADVAVVVAFRMLPEVVWSMPRLGTFNVHASLLPQYRGAAPIHWAIINGEKETGVTTFFLKQEIDTGDIILQERTPIGDEETTGELYNRLMKLGAQLALRTIELIENNDIHTTPQVINEPLKIAPKISKEMCRINWNSKAQDIVNLIRGMNPTPGAFTFYENKILKIYRAKAICSSLQNEPGSVSYDNGVIKVAVSDGFVQLLEVQPEGKKRMTAEEFMRGYQIKYFN
jgi:methionyl-tRNA formyltransferase